MSDSRPLLVTAVVLAFGLMVLWRGVLALSFDRLVLGVAAIALFSLVFIRTEFGLYVVIFSMLLSPEFSMSGGLAERREAALRLEDVLLGVIGVAWLAKTAVNKELGLVVKTSLNRPIAVYIGSQLIATLIGMVAGSVSTLVGLVYVVKYVEYFVVYYMVTNNLEDRRHAWRLVGAALVTAAIVSINGIAQIPQGGRVSAPFEGDLGEPNTFGGYLVMMLAIVAGLAFEARATKLRLVYTGLAGMLLLPFMYTLSRTSYLAAIPMLLTLFVLFPRRRLILGAVAVAGIVLALMAPPEAVQKRVKYTFLGGPQGPASHSGALARAGVPTTSLDSSTLERLEAYEGGLQAWLSNPFFGRGVTGYRFIDAQYPRLLAESGIVGFGAFLWLIASLLKGVASVYRTAETPLIRGLAGGFFAAIVAVLVHGVGANSFIIIRIMEPFWLFAAIVLAMPRLPETATRSVPAPRPRAGESPRPAPQPLP